MKASLHRGIDPSDRSARFVIDNEVHLGLRLLRFGAQGVIRRIGKRLVFLGRFFLRLLPFFFFGSNFFLQVIGEVCPKRRIVSSVERVSLKTLLAAPEWPSLDVHKSIFHRNENRFLLQRIGLELAQRRDVVKNVETTPERRQHQVVLSLLNDHVPHRDSWQPALELSPFLSSI